VTLSYRGAAFNRVKIKNRKRLDDAIAEGRITQMLESQVVIIGEKEVRMRRGAEESDIPNDAVLVCAGGELPTPFLKKIGIMVDVHHGA
jgi:thioredoxin reductase